MDWDFVLNLLSELTYFLVVFGIMWSITVFKGRQAIMNLIFGLYLALLLSLTFPLYEPLLDGASEAGEAIRRVLIFIVFTGLGTWLFSRVMPSEFQEEKLESMGKKLLLAGSATVLVMIFSFSILSITALLTPGTPIQSLFAPPEYFFGWLVLPLLLLFLI